MTTWGTLAGEVIQLYSPVGLRLVDELTSEPPLGSVLASLDIQDASGNWRPTDIPAVLTPSAVVSYPGLGRQAVVAGLLNRVYRVRLTADLYIPYYLANSAGIQFTAYPYDDSTPPAVVVSLATDTLLLPAPNYPFPSHIPVLRGVVVDANGKAVQNVYVTQGAAERALTDSRGTFALPLRWVQPNAQVAIDATDQYTGRTGTISAQLPGALNSNQTITIN
jgi:hypothetical protein